MESFLRLFYKKVLPFLFSLGNIKKTVDKIFAAVATQDTSVNQDLFCVDFSRGTFSLLVRENMNDKHLIMDIQTRGKSKVCLILTGEEITKYENSNMDKEAISIKVPNLIILL